MATQVSIYKDQFFQVKEEEHNKLFLNLQEAIALRNQLTARINEMQEPVAEDLSRNAPHQVKIRTLEARVNELENELNYR